ncbi:hypothetical protein Tco_1172644 [Tanacetum coccineum]
MERQCTQPKQPRNPARFKEKAMLAEPFESDQILNEEQLAFLADPGILDGQAAQTTIPNIAAFQTEDLDAYDSDCDDVSNAKAVLMANLSNYGFDIISEEKANQEKNNESLTVEFERYKERVKTFEQRLNIDLRTREKMIDSQMDDMIKEKLESQYMDKEIDLENKIKELDNIVSKVGQSAQTVHMLTKPQVFYDVTHKQALGYQNLFYLKKAQRIKPTLYDDSVISSQHVTSLMIDDEETLILEEVSRSKMLAKQNDPVSKEKKVNTTPINYVELNRLSEDFGKRFVPQQELSAEQAFWLQTSHPNTNNLLRHLSKLRLLRNFLRRGMGMKAAVQQCSVDKQCFEIVKKELFLENDRLLQQIMSQDILLSIMNSTTLIGESANLEIQRSESSDKCFDLDVELSKTQNAYNELLKSYSQLEKHCISLELSIQLHQEIFQKDKSCDNQNALEILEYFENNDLKAQLQAKDTTICKLKEHIKSMRENDKDKKVKQEMDEIETINIELEHSVAKLLSRNECLHKEIEHLKKIYKGQFDSIKRTRTLSKEYCNSLIAQLNSKFMENADLKGQIQDKELLVYVRDTCPNVYKPSEKLVVVTPMNKVKKVRFSEPLTSSSNIHKQVESSKTPYSNTHVLPSTGLKSSTSASRSQPTGNKKNDRISQTPSSNMKNKVEDHPRKVKSKTNKKNRVKDPQHTFEM